MSFAEELTRKINLALDKLMEEGAPLDAKVITSRIAREYSFRVSKKASDRKAFSEWCVRDKVRSTVRICISRRSGDPVGEEVETPKQYLLPGFKHIHRYYMVRREVDGEMRDIAVSIRDMTSIERLSRAKRIKSQGTACLAHAVELEEFDKQETGSGRDAAD